MGDKVNFIHRYLPDQGGSLGISDDLEIISRGYDLNTGTINFKFAYTSFSGLRLGLIAPSPLIVSVTDQSIFEIPDGTCYDIDYVIIINGETRTIIDVTANIITVDLDFTAIMAGDKVTFEDYNNASEGQHAKYAFVGVTGGDFADGSGPYLISF